MAKPYHMKGLGKGLDAHLPVQMATTLHAMCVDTSLNYAEVGCPEVAESGHKTRVEPH